MPWIGFTCMVRFVLCQRFGLILGGLFCWFCTIGAPPQQIGDLGSTRLLTISHSRIHLVVLDQVATCSLVALLVMYNSCGFNSFVAQVASLTVICTIILGLFRPFKHVKLCIFLSRSCFVHFVIPSPCRGFSHKHP